MLFVGTDEAGYGPMLGPLVIGGAAYVAQRRGRLGGRRVADSKVVYGRGGRDALASVVRPYLGFRRGVLRLSELLTACSIEGDRRTRCRWYPDVADEAPGAGRVPASFRRLVVHPVLEPAFNRGCRVGGGKGAVLFAETMKVVRAALAVAPDEPAHVLCDKHGGRNRYAELLFAEFAPRTLVPERESARSSSYRLTLACGRPVRFEFRAKADAGDVPVGLASLGAKYVRELFMAAMNSFFSARVAGLRPTAGYYGDGRRFLDEIRPVLAELGVPEREFVRDR